MQHETVSAPPVQGASSNVSFADLLQELRILQQGVQVLTAFLIILPFSTGFTNNDPAQNWVYLATFVCALSSLVLLSAPAAQHSLERPLGDRTRFKHLANHLIVAGLVPFSLALVLAAYLVTSRVAGTTVAWIVSGLVAVLITSLWWLLPLYMRGRD